MANCSMAYGTISLLGDWTDDMFQSLNIIKREWASWSYNIEISDDFCADRTEQSFFGCGRWIFCTNIEQLGIWTADEGKSKPVLETAYAQLTKEMQQRDCTISLSYSDEENGEHYLCDGTALLRADNGTLVVDNLSVTTLEYCWREFLERDFCGDDMLSELVEELFCLLQIDKEQRESLTDHVSKWAQENTVPNARADSLDEDQLSALKVLLAKQ